MEDTLELNNERVQEDFYQKYYNLSEYVARNILSDLGSKEDVEECVNDAMCEVMINFNKYDAQRGSLNNYIRVVTRSKALYKRKKLLTHQTVPLEDELCIQFVDEDPMAYKDLLEAILSNLRPKEKQLFTMRFLYYMPITDIAKVTGSSRGAVDKKLMRLRKKLLMKLNSNGTSGKECQDVK